MKYKVFVDGAEGTTGLKIHQYFHRREDIELLTIDQDKRKDLDERLSLIRKADISFLCLPDAAAREVAEAAPAESRILDTSTAHRTNPEWVYGMPELTPGRRDEIRGANRVAVPGCHATGAILLIRPLIEAGLVSRDYPFSIFSLTGYSGGGKKMIAQYEDETRGQGSEANEDPMQSPRQYGISQAHKHLPEIIAATGVSAAPAFIPVVADYYSGMEVSVAVRQVPGGRAAVEEVIKKSYLEQPLVKVVSSADESGFIAANRLAGTNRLEITVEGNDENVLLVATYDNLGKGASGAAIQNMNIMLGIDEEKGLV